VEFSGPEVDTHDLMVTLPVFLETQKL